MSEMLELLRPPPVLKDRQGAHHADADGGAGGVHQAVETEALWQALIINMVRGWLESLLPQPLEEILESERQEREQLRRLINRTRLSQP